MTRVERDEPPIDQVLQAARRGDEDVGLRLAFGLRRDRDAAVDGGDLQVAAGAIVPSSSVTWTASSRVGTSTSAGGRPSPASMRSTIGIAKASVLPEPVGALASTS